MNIKVHNLIIVILLITIGVMGWKIYDLKKSSEELKQFSVKTGVECIKNSKTMTQEEIEYCLPVMEMLGFKYKNETEED
jgi:predicted negative regulator of RcsB-dependent stress response